MPTGGMKDTSIEVLAVPCAPPRDGDTLLHFFGGDVKELGLTAAQIASHVQGTLEGDGQRLVTGIAPIERAQEGDITFIAQPKYIPLLEMSPAAAALVDSRCPASPRHILIRVRNPYYAFLQVARLFVPLPRPPAGIDGSAIIHPAARLGQHLAIGPHVVIEEDAVIGDGVVIGAVSFVGHGAVIGEESFLAPQVHIAHQVRLGKKVVVQSGAVIGSDGFGYVREEGRYFKIPHAGSVVLEDEVEVGANCTIDRGTFGDTVIGRGTKLDNLIHIAHNVQIGQNTVIAAQTGISGSVRIGSNVTIAGQVGFVDHIEVGDGATFGAQSGVSKSVPAGKTFFGYPAKELTQAKREEAAIRRLPLLFKRIAALEKALTRLNPDFRAWRDNVSE